MTGSGRMDDSPLTRAGWYGRVAGVLLGLVGTAMLVQHGNDWLLLTAVFVCALPAVWAAVELGVRSGLRLAWRVAVIFGSVMFVLSGCFVVGDIWRLTVGRWEQALVAGESSQCTGKNFCNRRYQVTLVGLPGVVHEEFSGQFRVGSTVRVLVDPTGLVGPSTDGERDRLIWSSTISALGAVPLAVAAAAALRRSRPVGLHGPPW